MHKKRGYKRDTLVELVRDYKLFAIVCEGSKREPSYFNVFRHLSSKIAVDVIEEIVSDEEVHAVQSKKSAPKWLLDRALIYIEKEGLNDEDDLWFVMDVDKWPEGQLRDIAMHCEANANWHIVLSNPCFEVWLYFHKRADISVSTSKSSQEFKTEIATLEKGGYHPYLFVPQLPVAIENAKAVDSDPKHFMPGFKETKVYQLGEAIMQVIGKNDFDKFIESTLPKLINAEKVRSKKKHL